MIVQRKRRRRKIAMREAKRNRNSKQKKIFFSIYVDNRITNSRTVIYNVKSDHTVGKIKEIIKKSQKTKNKCVRLITKQNYQEFKKSPMTQASSKIEFHAIVLFYKIISEPDFFGPKGGAKIFCTEYICSIQIF